MRDLNIWAYHEDLGTLCRDAGLDDSTGLSYPAGNEQGQAGWHVAVRFSNLKDLAKKLSDGLPTPKELCGNWHDDCETVVRGEIVRLAILAHGDQGGQVAINGRSHLPILTASNVSSFHADLHSIGLYTREKGSTILFMGCLAGQGELGTRLLVELSRVWPGRQVVAFATTGYRHPGAMKRRGEPCELPGMRDTDAPSYLHANPNRFDKLWKDFAKMPWASETSLHAKVVKNGKVDRCPDGEMCLEPAPVDRKPHRPPVPTKRKQLRPGSLQR